MVWRVIVTADGERTRRFATIEDDSRATASLVVVASCTASLAGAGFALHKASQVAGIEAALLTVGSVAVVVVSWLVVNAEFTLRYAHRFFSPPVGGIDFPGSDVPNYRDFAYLAFTIGMTYQVSDTALLASSFRRRLLAHARGGIRLWRRHRRRRDQHRRRHHQLTVPIANAAVAHVCQ